MICANAEGCFVCAAFSFSMYAAFLVLFPFAAPLIKLIAHCFPDKGLLTVRRGRQVVIDIVKKLMADRRADIEHEQASRSHPHACTWLEQGLLGHCYQTDAHTLPISHAEASNHRLHALPNASALQRPP